MKKLSSKSKTKKVPFSKLSKPEKRVAIAKDVLSEMKRKYIPVAGVYIHYMEFIKGVEDSDMESQDIQSNFKKIKECNVCALGACLMSATKFANKLNFCDIGDSVEHLNNDKVKKLFNSLFTPLQLLMIEIAFEGNGGGDRFAVDVFGLDKYEFIDIVNECDSFHQRYKNDRNRMTAIMKNIIENKGEFKP